MRRLYGILLHVLFVIRLTRASTICTDALERTNFCQEESLKNFVFDSDVLWRKENCSMITECAADCFRNSLCQSFTYNDNMKDCNAYLTVHTSTVSGAPENGWSYHTYCKETDCADVYTRSPNDGVYNIEVGDGNWTIPVYCDMATDGGGWLVFQRRRDGTVDFARSWDEFRDGFGDIGNEFWLGNDNIHRISTQKSYKLRVDLSDFNDSTCVAEYNSFSLSSDEDLFKLTAVGYSGDCGNCLSGFSGRNFTTMDRDHDTYPGNCAVLYPGGWWFTSCHSCHLNGQYNNTNYAKGVTWSPWRGQYVTLKSAEMKIRPV